MIGEDNTMNFTREITAPERFFLRSPHAVVTLVARIKGAVSSEMLAEAVNKLQQRHILLSTRIQEDSNHRQRFTSEGCGEIPIQIVPRSSKEDWINLHAEAVQKPFDFNNRAPMRFILVQSSEESDLIILCHHVICDGMSLAYLTRDIMTYLGEPAREVEVLPAPAPIDLENFPADVSQSFIVKAVIKRMNRKWAEKSVYFDLQDYRTLNQAYWDNYDHELFSIELSEEDTSRLVARCKIENTTVNSALTAAYSGAQLSVQGKQDYHARIVVAASLRDRVPKSPGEGMGMYAGGVNLKFDYNPSRGFWANAREFNQMFRAAYTNKNLFSDINNWLYLDPTILDAIPFKELGGLVPGDTERYQKISGFRKQEDVVARILKQDGLDSLSTKLWGTAVTNLGRLDFPTSYGALRLERMIFQPGGGVPLANVNLVLGAVTCAGKLSLVVEYAPQAVEPSTVEAINAAALAWLLED